MTWTVTCHLCHRDIEEALTVRVDFGRRIGLVNCCDECWSRGEEAADVEEGVAA